MEMEMGMGTRWDGDSGVSDVTAHDSPGCWSWSEKKEDLEARLLFQKEGMGS